MAYSKKDKEKIISDIVALTIAGKSITKICLLKGMPNKDTIFDWLSKDKDFSDRYARAKEIQAHCMFGEIIDLVDDSDPMEAAKTRIQVDTRKWFLAKVLPKIYGDKIDVTTNGDSINSTKFIVDNDRTASEIKKALGL